MSLYHSKSTKGGAFEDAFTALGVSLNSISTPSAISGSAHLLKVKRKELEQKMVEEREESILEQCIVESITKKKEIIATNNGSNIIASKSELLNLSHTNKTNTSSQTVSNKSLESVLLNCSHNLYEKELTKGKNNKTMKSSKKQSFSKRSSKSKYTKN